MAYTFPQNGGLQYTQGGKTVGVFFNDTPLGPVLIVGEKVDGNWLGRWNKGPQQEMPWKVLFLKINFQYVKKLNLLLMKP